MDFNKTRYNRGAGAKMEWRKSRGGWDVSKWRQKEAGAVEEIWKSSSAGTATGRGVKGSSSLLGVSECILKGQREGGMLERS